MPTSPAWLHGRADDPDPENPIGEVYILSIGMSDWQTSKYEVFSTIDTAMDRMEQLVKRQYMRLREAATTGKWVPTREEQDYDGQEKDLLDPEDMPYGVNPPSYGEREEEAKYKNAAEWMIDMLGTVAQYIQKGEIDDANTAILGILSDLEIQGVNYSLQISQVPVYKTELSPTPEAFSSGLAPYGSGEERYRQRRGIKTKEEFEFEPKEEEGEPTGESRYMTKQRLEKLKQTRSLDLFQ